MIVDVLTIDRFSDKIGHSFTVDDSGVPAVELTLTEVTALRNFAKAAREPFSLIFIGPGGQVLPQRMYNLRHAAIGRQAFFLVPIGATEGEARYQAIFN